MLEGRNFLVHKSLKAKNYTTRKKTVDQEDMEKEERKILGCFGADLNKIEAQRSTDVSHDQLLRRRSFPMKLINNCLPSLSSRDECTTQTTEDTGFMPEFFTNLSLSDFFDLPGEYLLMNPEMFGGLSDGNKEWLEELRSHETPIACLKSRQGDSVLHLFASWGDLELVKIVVSEFPCLLLEPNWKDQLSLHVAASAGYLDVVKALVASATYFSAKLPEEDKESLNLFVVKDINGDTPLHLALKGHNMDVASDLVKANRKASFLANKEEISPLYLAIEAGYVSIVKEMLVNDGPDLRSRLEGRKDLVHAALELDTDILDVILNKIPSLVDERDEEGRTCLSFGASVGNYKGVCNLLDRSTKGVYVCDDDGSFPIHVAVDKGYIKVVREILKRCPHSKRMLNKQGQNILHIAASTGKRQIIVSLVRFHETNHLANEKDVDGNTPLHLATIKWRPRAARCLVGSESLFIKNNNGLTPLDIAESNLQPVYIFRERLTLVVLFLKYAQIDRKFKFLIIQPLSLEKDYINALLLVAALIATVTFAAGFTLPGGFNSSAPNLGMAALATNGRLISFLMFDMLAMQFSVVAMISLMWAQLGDPALRRSSVNVALISLNLALQFMTLAFLFSMVIAAGTVTGLVIFISVTSILFLVSINITTAPHLMLQAPMLRTPFKRAIWSMYLNCFMMFLIENEDDYDRTSARKSLKRVESEDLKQ